MVFMLWVQKPVRKKKKGEEVKFDRCDSGKKWGSKRQNPPYYIVYIVSVHAFESLCGKAHSYNVWVDICSCRSQGGVKHWDNSNMCGSRRWKEAESHTYGSCTYGSEVAAAPCSCWWQMVLTATWEQRRWRGGGGEGSTAAHTLMWVHDESLLPDPHLFLEAGYTGTIANHFALSLSKVARLN